MTNAWDHAKTLSEKHASTGGIFVRLANNGDKVTGVFCGEPFAREVVWLGDHYEPYDATNPAHRAEGKRPSLRVAINFFVVSDGAMRVIEGGSAWFRDILKLRSKYGLGTWIFEIERHGEPKDPKTRHLILPEEKIDAELQAKIAATPLNDLPRLVGGEASDSAAPAAGGASDPDATIDADIASTLVARLKVLPRAALDGFLAELGVARVRDLKASQVGRAKALLDAAEGGGAAPAPVEVDPFA